MIVVCRNTPRREWICRKTGIKTVARGRAVAIKSIRVKAKQAGLVCCTTMIEPLSISEEKAKVAEITTEKPRRRPVRPKPKIELPKYEQPVPAPWPINQGGYHEIEAAIRHAYRNGKLRMNVLKDAENYEYRHAHRGMVLKSIRKAITRLKEDAKVIKST